VRTLGALVVVVLGALLRLEHVQGGVHLVEAEVLLDEAVNLVEVHLVKDALGLLLHFVQI